MTNPRCHKVNLRGNRWKTYRIGICFGWTEKPFCNRDVQKYIDENRDVLELEKKRDKYRNESENSN